MKRDCPLTPGSTVWAYFRDSGGEAQERSVGQQLDVAREYSARHGLHLAATFTDAARPGSSTVNRDALQDMLSKARALAPSAKERHPEAPSGILFWDTRRLGRDQLDNAFIKADLRRRGYTLIFLSDDIPDAGDFTPVIEAFLDWKAEQDLKDIGKDAQRGLQDLAKQGYHPGGFPPRGYQAERVQIGTKRNGQPRYAPRWIPDPETAPKARLAWEMRAAGASYGEIQKATGLYKNRNCWPTFFRNRTYLGIIKCGELEIPDAHEPLCTPEQWAAVEAMARQWRPKAWATTSEYLLSGLVTCGYCGDACTGGTDYPGNRRKTTFRYYICGRQKRQGWANCQLGKINAERVEEAVLDRIENQVLTIEFLQAVLQDLDDAYQADNLDPQVADRRAQIRELDKAIDALLSTLERAPSSSIGKRLVRRERERELLLAQVAALEAKRATHAATDVDVHTLQAIIEELRRDLAGDDATARHTLRRIVDRVELKKTAGMLYISIPAVLFAGTPGAIQTTGPRAPVPIRYEPLHV